MTLGVLADYASLIGLVISIVGFIATLRNVQKARKAAESAKEAAREAIAKLGERIFEEEISAILTLMTDVQTACRERTWPVAQLRCGDAIVRLARFSNHPKLVGKEVDDLMLARIDLAALAGVIDQRRSGESSKYLTRQQLATLQDHISALCAIQGRMRAKAFEH